MKVSRITDESPTLIEVPLRLIDFDGKQARQNTQNYIYSDLLFFHSLRGSKIGAVAGRLKNGRVQILSRSRYAAIAQDLGLEVVECFLPSRTPRSEIEELLEQANTHLIHKGRHIDVDTSEVTNLEWHTISFDGNVSRDQLIYISEKVNEVFHSDDGRPIELRRAELDPNTIYFRALTRQDRSQAVAFMAALHKLDQEVAPVRSYRGGRFKRSYSA
jgi:hypothetical protein